MSGFYCINNQIASACHFIGEVVNREPIASRIVAGYKAIIEAVSDVKPSVFPALPSNFTQPSIGFASVSLRDYPSLVILSPEITCLLIVMPVGNLIHGGVKSVASWDARCCE